MPRRILSVTIEDRPGALARISSLFTRRAFDVGSVTVCGTERPGVSRVTIVLDAEDDRLAQAAGQLGKLVNVLGVAELASAGTVERDMVLVRVRTDNRTRSRIDEIVRGFHARIANVSAGAVTIEATGSDDELKVMLERLAPCGIEEMVRSGTMAVGYGPRAVDGPVPRRHTAPAS